MLFSSLIAVFATILSVNAASINKRAPANVEACVSGYNSVSTQIDHLQSTVQSGGLIDTSTGYVDLEKAIEGAQGACCAINTVVADSDADYVTSAVSTITPKVQSLLSLVSNKLDDYHFITEIIVKQRLEKLQKTNENVNTCLIHFTPESKKATLQGYIDSMNTAFASTIRAYSK
ncbi:hypothetical protein BD770DRAFT_362178 [Pilaira anomala]|nr:hypothetical protein BD770DRAFT_362178 [Pilaira anomala]